MVVHHRTLHRMQPRSGRRQAFYGNQLLAIDRWQELYAGVDGLERQIVAVAIDFGNNNRARTAVAFGAAFLGAFAAQIFAQKLQHRSRRVHIVDLDDLTIEYESYGRSRHLR